MREPDVTSTNTHQSRAVMLMSLDLTLCTLSLCSGVGGVELPPPPTQSPSLPHLPASLSLFPASPAPHQSLARSRDPRPNLEAEMRAPGVCALCALLVSALPCGGSELPTLVQEQIKSESSLLKPKVMIAVLARNAAHSLPQYLGCIEKLQYPKERIAIW